MNFTRYQSSIRITQPTVWIAALLIGAMATANAVAQEARALQVVEQSVVAEAPIEFETSTIQLATDGSAQVQAPSISASDGASDYTITVTFSVTQNCLFAESNKVTVTGVDRNTGNTDVSWSKTYSDGYLSTRTGTLTWNVGPSESHTYNLSVRNRGGLGCDNTETASNRGSTSALKAPVNVSATANSSDRNVTISWGAGTNITDTRNVLYYRIYKNGQYIALRGRTDRSYVGTTTPGTEDTWGVATYFSGYTTTPARTSTRISRTATTADFKEPANLSASNGTTVRSVELNWSNPSDYANSTVIFREGEAIASVGAQSETYRDTTVVPGQPYEYCLTNLGPGGYETARYCPGSVGQSFFVRADDGTSSDNVRIDWTLTPTELSNVANIQVLRDGLELDVKNPSSTTYTDLLADPGKVGRYEIVLRDAANNVVLSDFDYGFVPADGEISGQITSEGISSGGVRDVLVTATPASGEYLYSLEFDGAGDYVHVNHRDELSLAQSYTIEMWLRPGALRAQSILAKGASAASGPFGLAMEDDGSLTFHARGGATSLSTSPLTPSEWVHVAVVQDERLNQLRLYLNGQASGSASLSGSDEASTAAITLGAGGGGSEAFLGHIDEVRIWSVARTDSAITANMLMALQPGVADVTAYWPVVAGQGGIVTDRSRGGGHHAGLIGDASWSALEPGVRKRAVTDNNGQGEYRIAGLLYENSPTGTLYNVTPTLENRAFDPSERFERLNDASAIVDDANFVDTTSVTIAGQVLFAATSCAVDSVEIQIDDIPSALTDEAGRYAVGGIERGNRSVRPVFRDHSFAPDVARPNVTGDIAALDFTNTTVRTLRGFVAGGECRADIGRARVTVSTANGCFSETVMTADSQYSLELPAQAYTVSVEMLDDPSITFTSQEVDLTDEAADIDFIYYAPPQITLSGFPETSCPTPILAQAREYETLARVTEQYGSTTCPASGLIEVFDEVGDGVAPLSTELDSLAILRYSLIAGTPNVVGGGPDPYQKKITFAVAGPGGEATAEQQVVVEGNRPREQTFTTVSPQIPMLILRDPPGDESYSYKEESQRTCYAAGLSLLADASVGIFSKVRAGTQFEVGAFGVSFETKVWGEIGSSIEVGARALGQTEREICMTHSTTYATSGNQEVTGAEGDVFIGSALNLLYAVTDVLEVDEGGASCPVTVSQEIIYDTDGFATQYHYTEDHIRNAVIPDLEFNRENAAEQARRQEFEDQIEVWQQTLALNERLKQSAVTMGDDFNLSFSANAPRETFTEWEVTDTESLEFNLYINSEVAVEAGVEVAGVGASGGVRVRASLDVGTSSTATQTTTNRTGFFLGDDDAGDAFTVDVKRDVAYGTPVFELVSGVSSYPWEQGTLPRDGVNLTLSPVTQSLPDAGATAEIIATLGNTGQNFETRPYELEFLQESNPAGAVVTIGGSPAVGPIPYSLGDSEARQVTVRLARAPSSAVYDYDDLQLVLRSPQDGQIADTASFSVHFDSPCSPLSLTEPAAGWIVNGLSNDSLRIVLAGYEASALQAVRFEVSPAGRNSWSPAFSIGAGDLAANQTVLYWQTESQTDGEKDFRAVGECNIGGVASTTATPAVAGTIDRVGPKLFGTPQPASGVLTRGSDIAATFNEPLACGTAVPENVRLTVAETGAQVAVDVACVEREVVVTPATDLASLENATLQVSLKDIRDVAGNNMGSPETWSFTVNQSPVYWDEARIALRVREGESADVVGRLNNAGADDVSFSLTEFPDWLEPTSSRGTVSPGGSERITFATPSGLQRGKYEGRVVATTTEGAEPMWVDLSVVCASPAWVIEPTSFAYTMSLTASPYLEDLAYGDDGDVLAAFVNGELRGVADLQKVYPQDEYAAFLTVFSNATAGEQVDFVLYDASECKERSISERVPFEADGVVGTAADLFALSVSDAVLQSVDLVRGWTWISFGVRASDMSADAVLGGMRAAEGDLIKGQTAFSQYVAGTGWVGSLDSLRSGDSYRIESANSGTLNFIGEPVDIQDHPIEVNPGWNWIGFLPDNSLSTNEALVSLSATGSTDDVVKGQFAFASFNGTEWSGSLGRMLPGEGYLLRRDQAGTLVYPGADGSALSRPTRIMASTMSTGAPPSWAVEAAAFENSMTLTAALVLEAGQSTNPESIVAAFAGDQVRGVARPQFVLDRWVFFLTVYADAPGELITFNAYDADHDTVVEVVESLTFQPEDTHGTPRDNFQLTSGTATSVAFDGAAVERTGLGQNYPNPVAGNTTIPYELATGGDISLEVFDTLGRRVAVVAEQDQAPGRYRVDYGTGDLATGTYLYRLRVNGEVFTRTMTVVK